MQLDLFIACQPLFGGDAGTSAGVHPATEPAKARRGVSCHCSCSFHLSASQQADYHQALRLGPLAADAVFIRLRKPGSADAVEFPAELLVTAGTSAVSSRVNLSVGSAVFPVVRHCITKVLCSAAVHARLQPVYQQLPQLVLADPPAAPAQPLAFATLVTPTISFNMHLRTPTAEDVQSLAGVMQVMLAPHMPEQQQQQQEEEDRRLSQQQEPAALERPLAAAPAPRAPGPSATTAVEESPPGQPGQDQLQQQQQQQRLPLTQLGAEGPCSSGALHPPAAGGGGAGPAPARLTGAKRPAPAAEGSPVQAADQPAVTAAAAAAAGGEASGAHGAAAPNRLPPEPAGAAATQRMGHAGVPPQLSSAWAGQLGLEVALLEQVCRQAAAAGGGGGGGAGSGAAPIAAGAGSEALLHHNLDALAHLHLAASSVPVWQGRA